MAARNGPAGYGWVSRSLHWVTVLVVAAQFAVGYTMDVDDSGRGRGRGRSGESGRGRGRGGDGAAYVDDPETLLLVHVALGLTVLVLVVVPVSGPVLVLAGDADVLPLHVGAHFAFFAALAAHLFLNLRPRILRRML